ncbi:MAG TPA: hypothetical protein VIX80_00035, partial [Candidatus Kapabacteria bacterium]
MKKYVLFLFVLVFICMSSGASSQTWEQIGPYGPRTVLKVAESDSALVILCDIAFGAGKRRIFRSEDKGKTWQEPSFPYDSLPIWLMGLDCTENIFYAWTERADICMSTDHGKTWVVRSDIDSQRLYFEFGSVLTIDDTLYFGWDKKYFTSIDSGLTWSSQKASVDDRMIRSAVLNDTIITVT